MSRRRLRDRHPARTDRHGQGLLQRRGVPAFSPNGLEMAFIKYVHSSPRDYTLVMLLRLEGGHWSQPQPAPFGDTNCFENNPWYSPSGDTLCLDVLRALAGERPEPPVVMITGTQDTRATTC
mgnify:CR=1 FL=1